MDASEQIKVLSAQLAVQKVAVGEKSAACETLLTDISSKTELGKEKQQMAETKSIEMEEQNKVIAVEKADAEASLAAALPALEEARLALSDLDKNDVTEIRSALFLSLPHPYHPPSLPPPGHLPSPPSRFRRCVSALSSCVDTRRSAGRRPRG